jgi:hypothetical protein
MLKEDYNAPAAICGGIPSGLFIFEYWFTHPNRLPLGSLSSPFSTEIDDIYPDFLPEGRAGRRALSLFWSLGCAIPTLIIEALIWIFLAIGG